MRNPQRMSEIHDREVVVSLRDPHLRALCTCATGLSQHALLRLATAAESLRRREGLPAADVPGPRQPPPTNER